MKDLEKNIFEYLSRHLSPERVEHSYHVSVFSVELAAIYGCDVLKAQTAALLHDCAKGMSGKELIKICEKNKIKVNYFDDIKKNSPQLLHSYVSAYIAEKNLKVKSKEILSAIKSHTLGRPGMGLLEKIIFVADAVSLDRSHSHSAKIRTLARAELEKAFICVLSNKIKYVMDSDGWLCLQAIDTWNYYAKKD